MTEWADAINFRDGIREETRNGLYLYSTLEVEYKDINLALYIVAWHEDNTHITEVSNLRVIETSNRSPQLTLWMLGPDEWLLFKKLSDYAARKERRKLDVLQLPLPAIDAGQQPAIASS